MFWQLFLVFAFVKSIFCVKLYLSIEENLKPTSPIGNLIKLINQTEPITSFQLESEKSNSFGQRNLIKIDPKNGDIWVEAAIDREEICQSLNTCKKEFLIFADSKIYELQIEIIDINDNNPSFKPDDKTLKIPEGIAKFTEYSLPVASDRDSEKYGIKNYYLAAISSSIYENYFKLVINPKSHNPYLKVIAELDREHIKNYEFNLYAKDGDGNQGKCRITVEITDVNDNTPQWIGLPYRKEISECTTDNKVLQLNAQDKDDPQTNGGQIQYKISDNSQNYEMTKRNFYITDNILYSNGKVLKSIDQNKISIVIIAADGEGRSNETTIELDIKDCNDHRPIIQMQSTNLKIHENKKSKTFITRITVKDNDQGINSEFRCSLNDTSYVNLESLYQSRNENGKRKEVYELSSIPEHSFDREKTSRYNLEITCQDNGIPSMSSSETIIIFIVDENDNPPRFENSFKSFSILEDAKIGSEVGSVIATDSDSSPNNIISYSINGTDDIKQTFSINNDGQIQLSKIIDREEKERYDFMVVASDRGTPILSDTCKIQVIVLDVNDNTPEISKEIFFKVVESWGTDPKHEDIGKLNASDRDKGNNGKFKFKTRSITSQYIQVYPNGRITVHGIIDREINEKIEAQIEVFDNGYPPRSATTTIFIEVLDLNDNTPKFNFMSNPNSNHINVSYDTLGGTKIGEVKASDPDHGKNGSVIYSLINQDSAKEFFTIHDNGQIFLNKKLKDKVKYPDRLQIEARDQGLPPKKGTTHLYIRYQKKKDPSDQNNENSRNSPYMDYKDTLKNKNKLNGLSNNAVILGFLVVSIMIILLVIVGVAVYIYCRGSGLSRLGDNGKQLATNRDSNNVRYQKGCPKIMTKSESQINNEVTMRNDNYNPVGIPNYQPNYTNLMFVKNDCFTPIDNSYQFSHTLLTDNYSAFQPKSNTPTPDKDNQEFSAFNPDESWNPSKHQISATTMQVRKKNISESTDSPYDTDHKYTFIHGPNINNFDMNHEFNNRTHFTTPSQNRRSDFIQSRSDTNQKVKISLVNSSFV